ncbi:MAG: HlyD family efflux transporter periplasmic adaptor subunit [Magnetococcales bacterium]|nr:HlyD family efflux transporter periplasmic adaptor subunit [Magnetococcales bacterium]
MTVQTHHETPELLQRQVHGLTTLLTLQEEARKASRFDELAFVVVNSTLRLVSYAQAIFWRRSRSGIPTLAGVSGVTRFDHNAPQMVWYRKAVIHLAGLPGMAAIQEVTWDRLPPALAAEAESWSHSHGIWLPMNHPRTGELMGGLWLTRDRPWEEGERLLLEHLVQGYAGSVALWQGGSFWGRVRAGWVRMGWVVLVLAAFFSTFLIEVRQTVLAPARVTAVDPSMVTAPMDGMVARFFVAPNAEVKKGDPLFALDDTELNHRYQLAREELALAQTQLHKVGQLAFSERDRVAELATNRNLVREASAKVDFAAQLVQRSRVHAAIDGVAVFSDPHAWLGRPVRLGERVLEIASPQRVEVTIELPVAEAMPLVMDAELKLFLDIDPLHPLSGRLHFAAYEATPTPEGTLVYLLKGGFDRGTVLPRLGLKGTAKVYGLEVSLFHVLFHRPIAAVRRWAVL